MNKKYLFLVVILIFIVLFLLESCPALFKDVETIYIDNKSDYTIVFFMNDEYKSLIAPDVKYETANYTNVTHFLLCTCGAFQWGPESVKLTKGSPFTWTIENQPEPSIKMGNITVQNNTSWTVNILIDGLTKGIIDPGESDVFSEETGNRILLAQPQENPGSWEKNIELTEEGYIWNLESEIESYPSENCRVWNFENNYADHLGVDDWDDKINTACTSMYKKFGDYSLFALPESRAACKKTAATDIRESHSMSAWIRVTNNTHGGLFQITKDLDDFIWIQIDYIGEKIYIRYGINKNLSMWDGIIENYLTDSEWNFVAFSYNKDTNNFYIVVNDTIEGPIDTSHHDFNEGTASNAVYSRNETDGTLCIDEYMAACNEFIPPQVFVDHYHHGVPWGAEYIAE